MDPWDLGRHAPQRYEDDGNDTEDDYTLPADLPASASLSSVFSTIPSAFGSDGSRTLVIPGQCSNALIQHLGRDNLVPLGVIMSSPCSEFSADALKPLATNSRVYQVKTAPGLVVIVMPLNDVASVPGAASPIPETALYEWSKVIIEQLKPKSMRIIRLTHEVSEDDNEKGKVLSTSSVKVDEKQQNDVQIVLGPAGALLSRCQMLDIKADVHTFAVDTHASSILAVIKSFISS
ncbi:hypothetical protein GQ42DRAFT_160500 [Ramicandelaber brevisporus]|nr:hypothetical protein GQ42DRAFT_160500 [Ramicandelaber brevisporus]